MLATLQVGERRYFDTRPLDYARLMHRLNPPASRRVKELQGRKFVTNLFTAVSNSKVGEIRYLVCVEREK